MFNQGQQQMWAVTMTKMNFAVTGRGLTDVLPRRDDHYPPMPQCLLSDRGRIARGFSKLFPEAEVPGDFPPSAGAITEAAEEVGNAQ